MTKASRHQSARRALIKCTAVLSARAKALGVSRSDIARTLEVNRAQVTHWLGEKAGLNAVTLFKLAEALGCKVTVQQEGVPNVTETFEAAYQAGYAAGHRGAAFAEPYDDEVGVACADWLAEVEK